MKQKKSVSEVQTEQLFPDRDGVYVQRVFSRSTTINIHTDPQISEKYNNEREPRQQQIVWKTLREVGSNGLKKATKL